jgi:hypothetical protein
MICSSLPHEQQRSRLSSGIFVLPKLMSGCGNGGKTSSNVHQNSILKLMLSYVAPELAKILDKMA